MTDRRGDEGYAVAPERIGGSSARGSRRGRWIGVIVVLGVAFTILAAAWIGPRLDQRPNFDVSFFATPVPSATPTPGPTQIPGRSVAPTPLPEVTRAEGRTITGQLAIWTDSFHVMDLATGQIPRGTAAQPGIDAVAPAPNGDGWTCVCMADRPTPGNHMERGIQVVRIDASGAELSRRTVATLHGLIDPNGTIGIQTDVEVAPDGRSALLVFGERDARSWAFSAARVDLVDPAIGPSTALGRQAFDPTPSAMPSGSLPGATPLQVYTEAYGPVVRRSPDGRLAFAWSTIQQYTEEAQLSIETTVWRIELDGSGGIAAAAAAPGLAEVPPYCNGVGFLRDDRFVAACPFNAPEATNGTQWRVVTYGPDGRTISRADVPATENWYSEPLFDRANGVVWMWDSASQNLVRVAVDTNEVKTAHYDYRVDRAPGDPPIPGAAPTWARPISSTGGPAATELAGAPDGSRIYLVGYGTSTGTRSQGPPSYGVFVVDPTTLALVDRWDPAAEYISVQPILGGTAVAAIGAPGIDANGDQVPWQASMTIHDASDGRILVRFGQLGDGTYPAIVAP